MEKRAPGELAVGENRAPQALAAAIAPLVLPAVCCAKGSVRFIGAMHSQRELVASQGSRGWRGIVHLCCCGGGGDTGGREGKRAREEREKRMRLDEQVGQERAFCEVTDAQGVLRAFTFVRAT